MSGRPEDVAHAQAAFRELYSRMLQGVRLYAVDGAEVPMVNEYENVDGPGWLHTDRAHRDSNVQLLRNGVNFLSKYGYAGEEALRARNLAAATTAAGVARIVYATPEVREFFTFQEEARRLLGGGA